jgi:peptidoglycan/LPS O-acetylase OafA/YrhL
VAGKLLIRERSMGHRDNTAGLVAVASRRNVDGVEQRLVFVDALRGIAALLVVLDHVGKQVSPDFRALTTHVVDVGQLGVVVFFLCSGFVIPAALERDAAIRVFWVKRFFRLYPLFWLSLIAAGVFAYTGIAENGHLGTRDWVANVSMVPGAFQSQVALPVYWTLAYEMIFYVFATVLVLARLSHLSVEVALMTSGACALLAISYPLPVGAQFNGAAFWITTLLVGAVLYRWFVGQVGRRATVACVVAAPVAGVLLLVTGLYGKPRPSGIGVSHFWPLVTAWVGAYVVFLIALAMRKRRMVGLAALGAISYSLYVLHPLVLVAIPLPSAPLLAVLIGLLASVAVSAVTYRYIERPAIDMGRRVARRMNRGVRPAPQAQPVATE